MSNTALRQVWLVQDAWGDVVQVHSEAAVAKKVAERNNIEDPDDHWYVTKMPVN